MLAYRRMQCHSAYNMSRMPFQADVLCAYPPSVSAFRTSCRLPGYPSAAPGVGLGNCPPQHPPAIWGVLEFWCAWPRSIMDMQKGWILVTGLWKRKRKKDLSRRIDLAKYPSVATRIERPKFACLGFPQCNASEENGGIEGEVPHMFCIVLA